MQLIDIGVNFHSKQLRGLTNGLIERAKAADVVVILAAGTSLQSSHDQLALAHWYPGYLFPPQVYTHIQQMLGPLRC